MRKPCRPGIGPDANRPPRKKAKLIRLERKYQKLLKRGLTHEAADAMLKQKKPQQQEGKSLEDLLNEPLPANPDHRLEPWHPTEGPPQGYGSFHQQYWMNGRLIAVGVIDILPRCVSSVYFYYDPELGHLSLGTYASLREISLTRSLHGHASALQYYYMGFYIHTCPKMQYKASYNPSFLLCPEVYTWHPVGECKACLDRSRYCRFNDDPSAKDKDGDVVLNEVLVLFNQRAMLYYHYVAMSRTGDDAQEVSHYAKLVGMKCARRMLLYRP